MDFYYPNFINDHWRIEGQIFFGDKNHFVDVPNKRFKIDDIVAFCEEKGLNKNICANVDLYSGLVYRTLGIPEDLYTPMFAIARVAGWCAHRLEELATNKKIMRPAYKSLAKHQDYRMLAERLEETAETDGR